MIRLRSTLLINIRPSSGIQALADMMEKNTEAKWGNWIGMCCFHSPRDDPLDYVREAEARIDRKKHSLEANIHSQLQSWFLNCSASRLQAHFHTRSSLVQPCASQTWLDLWKKSAFMAMPWNTLLLVLTANHILMINFQSYVNKMTIVLLVDDNTISDPHKMLDDLDGSLKLIKEAVYAKRLVKQESIPEAAFT
ncbi:O-acyltransferase WSD1 [Artemisia annua]|uniref:O-acyltransferase WSD1 n=1 Tax=Artemisia annua TaxID=35608 RepID=A0A2U1K9Z1_ARTAN|nr:O-acyltransferase WSD1 [Artemisia annua]